MHARCFCLTFHAIAFSVLTGSAKRKAESEHVSQRLPTGPLVQFQKKSRSDSGSAAAAKADSSESKEVGDAAHEVDSVLNLLQEAKEGPEEAAHAGAEAVTDAVRPKKSTSRNVPIVAEAGVTFPERLMELIMNETYKGALWWLPDDNAFCINSKKFTKTVLANNFQGSKFESFTRKLARWYASSCFRVLNFCVRVALPHPFPLCLTLPN